MNKDMITVAINGDSGEGVQLLGQLLSRDIARAGIHIKTEPNFPAEIRAPQGTLAGISGFTITAADNEHFVVDEDIDVLVALNPAGLHKSADQLKAGGLLLINSDQCKEKDYKKANINDGILLQLKQRQVEIIEVPITTLTLNALKASSLAHTAAKQCKNMFILGALLYLFESKMDSTKQWLTEKLNKRPEQLDVHLAALNAGYYYFEVQEYRRSIAVASQHNQTPGTYRQINGNQAFALAAVSLVMQLKRSMILSGYPITPATSILQEMQAYTERGIHVIQAEDEIAACGIALGASYGGSLGLTCTSGPGLDLKMEMIGLAVVAELPLVVIDVQRAGPSTGMPTKTEQSDLLQAIHGRHGESPCVVIAAHSAVDCFDKLRLAYEIAITFSTPVILLSDASIANSIEVWQIPQAMDPLSIPDVAPPQHPFERNKQTKGRVLFDLGQKEVIQTLGGLEKDPETGNVSYDTFAHKRMTEIRREKLSEVNNHFKGYHVQGELEVELLLVCWGSTYAATEAVYYDLLEQGISVGLIRLDILNPINEAIRSHLTAAQQVLVIELNEGQLCSIIRSTFLIDAQPISQLTGAPFAKDTLKEAILQYRDQGAAHG
jgi:2-oxoglutarate ferredoxin oxidoreductase subunit alpha